MSTLPRIHPMLQELLDEVSSKSFAAAFSYALGRRGTERFEEERTLDVIIRTHKGQMALARKVLEKYSGKATLHLGDVLAARVLPEAILPLASVRGVLSVRPSLRVKRHLDRSVADLCGQPNDPGTRPTSLRQYTGAGVVVGIVDSGIDWRHPDFCIPGTNPPQTRILAMLDQVSGATFDRAVINNALARNGKLSSDDDPKSHGHGTHVASIAVGNGEGSGGRYQGVAPDAEILIVRTTFRIDAVGEGIQWIFREAGNRPAVVNLSLGFHGGPHDGTGDFDAIVDHLSGDGRIIAVSAGNEGNDQIHAGKILKTGERWVADFSIKPVVTPTGTVVGMIHIEAYHAKNEDLTVTLRTPYGDLLLPRQIGDFEQFSGNAKVRFTHGLTVGGHVNYSLVVTFPRGFSPGEDGKGWSFIFKAGKTASTVHAWITDGDNGTFVNFSNECTVAEPATAHKVIAVAAHCTKKEWDASDGTHQVARAVSLGDIAHFSSIGPTRDGRHRPDLSAPGFYVMAALSDAVRSETLSTMIDVTGRYQVMAGTSMSCPHVTGAIALLLQKRGSLSPLSVRSILHSAATRSGTAGWDPRWGMGKLDLTKLLA